MHSQLFESALGISDPWFVNDVNFDATANRLTINIDFVAGYCVHDTVVNRYRHLNVFQLDCYLEDARLASS